MGPVAYLGTVVAICGLALGAMYVVVGLLGRRIDDLRADMNRRFDDVAGRTAGRFTAVEDRLARVETQNDTILGAVTDVGQRVTRLEARPAS